MGVFVDELLNKQPWDEGYEDPIGHMSQFVQALGLVSPQAVLSKLAKVPKDKLQKVATELFENEVPNVSSLVKRYVQGVPGAAEFFYRESPENLALARLITGKTLRELGTPPVLPLYRSQTLHGPLSHSPEASGLGRGFSWTGSPHVLSSHGTPFKSQDVPLDEVLAAARATPNLFSNFVVEDEFLRLSPLLLSYIRGKADKRGMKNFLSYLQDRTGALTVGTASKPDVGTESLAKLLFDIYQINKAP